MPSEATNRATRRGWRELGFFYDRDDQNKLWKLTGSRTGLLRFRDALLSYAADPRNALKSEHQHYGPYSYLTVMTWPEAGFNDYAIRGPLADLARLADLIETQLAKARPGSTVRIRESSQPIVHTLSSSIYGKMGSMPRQRTLCCRSKRPHEVPRSNYV